VSLSLDALITFYNLIEFLKNSDIKMNSENFDKTKNNIIYAETAQVTSKYGDL
jgi:hypothetical protein